MLNLTDSQLKLVTIQVIKNAILCQKLGGPKSNVCPKTSNGIIAGNGGNVKLHVHIFDQLFCSFVGVLSFQSCWVLLNEGDSLNRSGASSRCCFELRTVTG